ncbi:MAG: hydroxypyruvate reductase [Candidatus Tectimicrobiota bacterium]|nr:MAG: hydroxypyruvate reductase [Candidatus Tectomicrobia bacterium]
MRTEAQLREDSRQIFAAGVAAVDPAAAVRRVLRRQGEQLQVAGKVYDLRRFAHLYVIGAGKAGATMVQGVEAVLGERVHGGAVVVKYGHALPVRRVTLYEAGHPLPDAAGVRGAEAVMAVARQAQADDLVLCLLSGGGSALLPAPSPGITLEEKQQVTDLLLACGARIDEINAVRKHLSQLKGGQLARLVAPATLVTLVLSDVVGDRLDVIASGPTVPDPTTFAEALAVLARYDLLARVPASVRRHLEAGQRGEIPETPKPGEAFFARTQTVIVGNNRMALLAAQAEAQARGYATLVLSSTVQGETRDVARMHAAMAREIRSSGLPLWPPACLLSGGETTVTLNGGGKGGRNQEFALAAALDLAGLPGVVVLSGGTDGTDGPTDAAGALADGHTVARAQALGLDAARCLQRHDAYPFFAALGDLLHTGPTGTNVMDLHLVLVG